MLRNTLHIVSSSKTHSFARYLRKHQTSGERALWRRLRAKRFHGLKFRRQVPFGPYIVDFLCVQKKLIIEIDGGSHFLPGAKQKDEKREIYLRQKGFDVLRFSNNAAVNSTDWILTEIAQHLHYEIG